LHPSGVAKSSTSFGWGKGGKVTSAGWQVTLCDLIWHVISPSDYELLYPAYLLTYLHTYATLYFVARQRPGPRSGCARSVRSTTATPIDRMISYLKERKRDLGWHVRQSRIFGMMN